MKNYLEKYSVKQNKVFYQSLLRLAIPMGLTALLGSLLNMIDTLMIERLGKEAIVAVGSSNKLYYILNITLYGIFSGFGVFISQFWGRKDLARLQSVFMSGLFIGMVLSSIVTLLAITMPGTILQLFSDDPLVLEQGRQYLRIVSFSYILSAVLFSLDMVCRSTEQVKLPLLNSIVGILFNVGLNYILIFGKLGFDAMGIEGAAIATVLARGIQLLVYLGYIIISRNPVLMIKPRLFKFEPIVFKQIFKRSLPVVGNEFIWALGMTTVFIAYGKMGTNALASIQLYDTVFSMLTVFMWGVANASAIMIGKKLGEGGVDEAKWYAKLFIVNSFIIGGAIGLLTLSSVPIVPFIFTKVTPSVIRNLQYLLAIASFFMPIKLLAATFIVGILRSGGDTIFSFFTEAGCLWLWAVPVSFVLVLYTSLPLPLVYLFVSLEEVFKVTVCMIRFKQDKYIHHLVTE
jgi:putative MATE family efflux protein